MSSYLVLLLILACPLMMIWMMRGGHGHAGHGGHRHGDSNASLAGLRRQRAELDREIEERGSEEETPTPAVGSDSR
jgi:Protein of unknown function (DUF2933)